MNQPHYPVPPPQPVRPPTAPTRTIGIVANVISLVVVLGSFGGCMKYGCDGSHLSDDAAGWLMLGSGFLCFVCGVVAVVNFSRASTDKSKNEAASTAGIVLSIIWGIAASLLSAFFWLMAGFGGLNFLGAGRALRVGGKVLTPTTQPSSEWAKGPRPDVRGLDVGTRAVLRDLWLADACKEHASVPAFGQVAWQLIALGAPSDLVRRAHTAAIQEIDHAERCFALASAYAGEDLGVREMPALHEGASLPKDRIAALTKVAVESLVDGALGEDYNAALAAAALANVRDDACREALVRIVADESEHARLGWDIVAFCIERGAPIAALRNALAGASFKPFYEPALVDRSAGADRAMLVAHGRVDADVALYRERHEDCRKRLAELTELRNVA